MLPNWTTQQILEQLNSGYKWSGSSISYSFPTTTSGLSGSAQIPTFSPLNSEQQSKAALALQLWGDLISPSIIKTSVASDIEFGLTDSESIYAQTYYPEQGTVWFNKNEPSLTTPTIGSHGFISYIHEIGHALGLDHMGIYDGSGKWTPSSYQDSTVYSVMSYFGPDWKKGQSDVAWADWTGPDNNLYAPQTPQLNDIMVIQNIYGASITTRIDNTTYGFDSNITGQLREIYDFSINKNPILTIFDSGGVDTLDLSGWSADEVIDLRPGMFSSANQMTNNIAIAYNTIIERAIGGTGNDQFTGNSANNFIDGSGGYNTVVYNEQRKDFLTKLSGNQLVVTDSIVGREGIDTLLNIERVKFSDGSLVLDIPSSANNSSLYRFYQASFARTPDEQGFRYWVEQSNKGLNISSISSNFITSDEFKTKYGTDVSNAQYIELLYKNVLDRSPDATGAAFWNSQFTNGILTKNDALVYFANSPEDVAKTAVNTDNGYWLV